MKCYRERKGKCLVNPDHLQYRGRGEFWCPYNGKGDRMGQMGWTYTSWGRRHRGTEPGEIIDEVAHVQDEGSVMYEDAHSDQ
jgi:hypothetical protein